MRESAVSREFCIYLQKKVPHIRVFRRNVGLFKTFYGGSIKVEKKGMADLYAICPVETPDGVVLSHIEIEIKTKKGQQSKAQKSWQRFIESIGGLYVLVREGNYKDAIEEIEHYTADRCIDYQP